MFTDAPFEPFGLSHGVAVALVVLIGVALLFWVRKNPNTEMKGLRYTLAGLLFYTVLSGSVNAYLRYSGEALRDRIYHVELPLFLCDVVSLVLVIALLKKSQRLAEICYIWAMAGTAQGLMTPVLGYDWPSLEYCCFFLQHGLAPISAILLVWGVGLKPEAGAYKRVWLATWIYFFSVSGLNFLLGTNYGYLNGKPKMPTALDYLGDYPWYLLSLHGIAAVVFWILLIPFMEKKATHSGQND